MLMRFQREFVMASLLLAGTTGWAQVDLSDPPHAEQKQQVHRKQGASYSTSERTSTLLFQRIGHDQRRFWSSPLLLRRPGAFESFLTVGGLTGILFASDRSIRDGFPERWQDRSVQLSNLSVASLGAGASATYAVGWVSHDPHLKETGILSGEAAFNSLFIASVIQRATGRNRPLDENGRGSFLNGGTSFPSNHSAAAWAMATVIAHEYPGPLTKLMAYGLASTVTFTRVSGRQHFASDAFIGSAMGWYVGRQIYQAHHNPDLEGAACCNLESEDGWNESSRPPGRMGSPYVPLDSWVYPAIEKLAAFGYIKTAFFGIKPWTRIECAQLVEMAGDELAAEGRERADLSDLQVSLRQEFADEFRLLEGDRNLSARLESVYTRAVSVSGAPLVDGDHFGQTLSYDFGRPFRRGINLQAGAYFRAAIGPAALFVRVEFQHSPSAPALSENVRNFIGITDWVPVPPARTLETQNRPRLLDAYIAVNLREGWQLAFGQQSLSWGPGPGGSFLWSDNIEPVLMFRLTRSESRLPAFLKFLGPARSESFIGRLEGHSYIPHPYIYGNKVNFKPLPNLELGFGRTVTIGGTGGTPLTTKNFFLSAVGQKNSQLSSVPGDSHSSFDWTFTIPNMRNYLVFYGDLYADDDFLPFQNLPKNPFRPGIYLTRFPGVPKLDFHIEAASSESPGYASNGNLNYWNSVYRDGYTNGGNLIGNTVGRRGRSIQCWFNYWISPRNTLQFVYRHNSVSSDFVPGGGSWQDYSVKNERTVRRNWYVKSQFQLERISKYPLLLRGPQTNATAVVEVGFLPRKYN